MTGIDPVSDKARSPFAPPPLPVATAAMLIAASLAFVAAVRLSGVGPTAYATPAMERDAAAAAKPRATRDLTFQDRDDRAVAVIDAETKATVAILPPGTNGFLRQTLRGLAHERIRQGGSSDQPFRLSVWDDGRVHLTDLSTGRVVALEAFGLTNRQAFAGLVLPARNTP